MCVCVLVAERVTDCRQRSDVRHSGHFQRAARLFGILAGLFHSGRSTLRRQILQVHR